MSSKDTGQRFPPVAVNVTTLCSPTIVSALNNTVILVGGRKEKQTCQVGTVIPVAKEEGSYVPPHISGKTFSAVVNKRTQQSQW